MIITVKKKYLMVNTYHFNNFFFCSFFGFIRTLNSY